MTASRRSAFGRICSATIAALVLGGTATAARAVSITLTPFASGFTNPLDVVNAGDSRLFVVEQGGHIKVVQSDGTVLGTDFLDLSGIITSGGERGLLGLAFHPNYLSNGFFYVNYTDLAGDTQIVRYSVSGSPMTSNVANPLSATPVLSISQPFANHNAGDLKFGPDGYLYIPMGDGGSFCDPADRAQNPAELLGKILRIDVDSMSPYGIPGDNPFVGPDGVLDEIWAFGLRNPFRFSFDRANGDMYIGDVGQNRLEEIDVQPALSPGGENYGWDCFEGNDPASTSPSSCTTMAMCAPSSMFVFPVHDYDHSGGRCAVTGGFVYRGSAAPTLVGHYFFADFCSSDFYSLTTPGYTLNTFGQVVPGLNPAGFGEDINGELYVAGFDGTVYRIGEPAAPPVTCPSEPDTGCTATTKGKLDLKHPGDPAKQKLLWKWQNGPALSPGDFGNPVSGGTTYALCIYAGTGAADISAAIPGGSTWKATSTGYKFKDTSASPDGISKVLLKAGAVAGKSKLQVKGKGANLDLSAMPLDGSTQVLVQLLRNDAPGCWETTFPAGAIDTSDGTRFKAKIP